MTDCTVTRVLQQENRATALETSQGVVNVGDAQLVLAMGTLPPTTLVLNSFPQVKNAGERFTAHFITSVVARVRRTDYQFHDTDRRPGAGGHLRGRRGRQDGRTIPHPAHCAFGPEPDRQRERRPRATAPGAVATASPQQLLSSEDYVVFVCAVLGEIAHPNPDTWFRKYARRAMPPPSDAAVRRARPIFRCGTRWTRGTFQTLQERDCRCTGGGVEYCSMPNPDGSGSGTLGKKKAAHGPAGPRSGAGA